MYDPYRLKGTLLMSKRMSAEKVPAALCGVWHSAAPAVSRITMASRGVIDPPASSPHDGREKQLAASVLPCAGCRGTSACEHASRSDSRLGAALDRRRLRQNSRGDAFDVPRDGATGAQVGAVGAPC